MTEGKAAPDSRLWTPGRIIATGVVAGLVATIGYVVFFDGRSAPREPKVELPAPAGAEVKGSTASDEIPPDFKIPTMDGKTIRLSDYRGKVLVVDFWATWCPPCQRETRELVRIANELGPRGVEVVGLHIDDQGRSTPDEIRRFIKDYEVSYTVGLATNEMFIAYLGDENDVIPQTLVFGRDGKVVRHFTSYDQPGEVHAAVMTALGGS